MNNQDEYNNLQKLKRSFAVLREAEDLEADKKKFHHNVGFAEAFIEGRE